MIDEEKTVDGDEEEKANGEEDSGEGATATA